MSRRPVLVAGFGVTGRAVAAALVRRGVPVIAFDDRPGDPLRRAADSLGVQLVEAPDGPALERMVRRAERIVPAPGLPDAHPVFALARADGTRVVSEFDLAREWDDRPVAAITGTDGKTTVTTLVTEMLCASGIHAVAAGNTDVPLVQAIEDPIVDVFVVEASSFRLGHSECFSPRVATWLNFAPDHLDVHASIEAYEHAKASIFRCLPRDGVAVANIRDEAVMRHVPADRRTLTFGAPGADYHVAADVLVGEGDRLLAIEDLWRSLPHDIDNALAAAATARQVGAQLQGIRSVLSGFRGLRHRVETVGEWAGIRWVDDSKATTPHAACSAVSSFDRVVLIAGGSNKGLEFEGLRALVGHIVALVAIGRDGADVARVLEGHCPVERAASMDEAVARASALATRGDVVLLSPGCASFDWYANYAERGDDFVRAVRALHEGDGA
jgi:UDP-N-acetylmuramoylalanine--D-glutamate ligase